MLPIGGNMECVRFLSIIQIFKILVRNIVGLIRNLDHSIRLLPIFYLFFKLIMNTHFI